MHPIEHCKVFFPELSVFVDERHSSIFLPFGQDRCAWWPVANGAVLRYHYKGPSSAACCKRQVAMASFFEEIRQIPHKKTTVSTKQNASPIWKVSKKLPHESCPHGNGDQRLHCWYRHSQHEANPEESPLSLRKMPAEDDTKLHRVCGDYIRQTLLAACRRPFSHLTTGIKPACAVRSLPPWLIWMFFAVVLADLALRFFSWKW